MEKKRKVKKIPIVSYFCYLLAVSILFTGVTFARYTAATSGDATVSVADLVYSYTIENLSTAIFPNNDYYLTMNDQQVATKEAASLRFTISNQKDGRVSPVDLQASLRFYLPAELADTLALQLTTQDGNVPVTPQIVLSELLYDQDGGYRQYEAGGETIDTSTFTDYDDRGGESGEREMQVSGGLGEGTGTVVASYDDTEGISLFTVSAQDYEDAPYSVGFARNSTAGNAASVFYLHCRGRMTYYTVDISVPAMYLEGNTTSSRTFVLYLTSTKKIESGDFGVQWEEGENSPASVLKALEDTKAPVSVTADGRQFTVDGYRFEQELIYYRGGELQPGTTTVRVEKSFTEEDGAKLAFSHVSRIEAGGSEIVHDIPYFYQNAAGDAPATAPATIEDAQNLFGECTNNGIDDPVRICFAGVTDDPIGEEEYVIGSSQQKSYETQLNVRFVQRSVTGGSV